MVDGGTGGFHLLAYFEKYDDVILVDATFDGREPGTTWKNKPKFATDFPPAMSNHDIGLKDMVTALQFMDKMPEIELFVVSIRFIQDQGIGLRPAVKSKIQELVRLVKESLD